MNVRKFLHCCIFGEFPGAWELLAVPARIAAAFCLVAGVISSLALLGPKLVGLLILVGLIVWGLSVLALEIAHSKP